ncbi:unnamed protein product [Amaranthus hypochondriacus]
MFSERKSRKYGDGMRKDLQQLFGHGRHGSRPNSKKHSHNFSHVGKRAAANNPSHRHSAATVVGKPKDNDNFQTFKNHSHNNHNNLPPFNHHHNNSYLSKGRHPVSGLNFGHRGYSGHQWRRGPREPIHSGYGVVSLFVDGISRAITLQQLRRLFEKEGDVADVYISGKRRKNRVDSFGFVRYYNQHDANRAIKNLNESIFKGGKLLVSMAKYEREGLPRETQKVADRRESRTKTFIKYPSPRDHRKYSEVVMGIQQN